MATLASPAPPAPRKRGAAFWLAIIFGIVAGGSLLLNLLLLAATAALALGGAAGDQLIEEQVEAGSGPHRIAVIELEGVITGEAEGGLFGPGESPVERVRKRLRQAAEDERVKAVVLALDTPGGGVTASDELHYEVKKLREAGKPVVVHMGDLCASGGMYIAAAADHLIASPTTIAGSIGVIFGHLDASELLAGKLGVRVEPITSGRYKDIGSMSRPMLPEERAILQGIIDEMHLRFVDLLATGRAGRGPVPGDPAAAKAYIQGLADGRICTAQQALAQGLADGIGYRADAIAEARKRGGAPQAGVIRYRGLGGWGLAGASAVTIGTDASAAMQRLLPQGGRCWYLWQSGM